MPSIDESERMPSYFSAVAIALCRSLALASEEHSTLYSRTQSIQKVKISASASGTYLQPSHMNQRAPSCLNLSSRRAAIASDTATSVSDVLTSIAHLSALTASA